MKNDVKTILTKVYGFTNRLKALLAFKDIDASFKTLSELSEYLVSVDVGSQNLLSSAITHADRKFAPGPWKVSTTKHKNKDLIKVMDRNNWPVAHVYGNGKAYGVKYTQPQMENAHILAAAPNMLEELEQTFIALEDFSIATVQADMIVPLWVCERMDYIKAAIKQAKGEE